MQQRFQKNRAPATKTFAEPVFRPLVQEPVQFNTPITTPSIATPSTIGLRGPMIRTNPGERTRSCCGGAV